MQTFNSFDSLVAQQSSNPCQSQTSVFNVVRDSFELTDRSGHPASFEIHEIPLTRFKAGGVWWKSTSPDSASQAKEVADKLKKLAPSELTWDTIRDLLNDAGFSQV